MLKDIKKPFKNAGQKDFTAFGVRGGDKALSDIGVYAGNYTSYYGLRNSDEFFSEGFAAAYFAKNTTQAIKGSEVVKLIRSVVN